MDRAVHETQERDAGENERHRRLVPFLIIAVVVVAAIALAWWAVAAFGGPRQGDAVAAVDGYFLAGARNDVEVASAYIYGGEDAAQLGADDLTGPFDAEIFFAYRGVHVRHYFADGGNAYLFGLIEYNQRPSREFTAVLREDDTGWGLLRLWLSEPLAEERPAAVLLAAR